MKRFISWHSYQPQMNITWIYPLLYTLLTLDIIILFIKTALVQYNWHTNNHTHLICTIWWVWTYGNTHETVNHNQDNRHPTIPECPFVPLWVVCGWVCVSVDGKNMRSTLNFFPALPRYNWDKHCLSLHKFWMQEYHIALPLCTISKLMLRFKKDTCFNLYTTDEHLFVCLLNACVTL